MAVIAFLRNTWRGLTSMRTALVLLFLLALAALPGALLPQYSLNQPKVGEYIDQHPTIGPWLDRLGFFDVYASTWFAAIYLLLFVSLIGCLLPRTVEYARQLRARPVLTPRNLGRLPHHSRSTVDASVDEVISVARKRLGGWRIVERQEDEGGRSISAERGFSRETGNLVFHFALLGLLVAFAVGKLFNYEGQVIVLANGSQFCNSGLFAFDSHRVGLRVDGTDLNPFCVRVDGFSASYQENGQPESFLAKVAYQEGQDLAAGNWRPYDLEVNSPLRLSKDRVYLQGHGYAPKFTVHFPSGQQRTGMIQWKPANQATLLSEGATKFDPPEVSDPEQRRESQLAIRGLFAPTAGFDHSGKVLTSVFPDLRDPAVAIEVLRGDLGNESGRPQSIFGIDQSMMDSGRLRSLGRKNLRQGEELRLDDGTVVRFDGVEQWASLQVSYDPAQQWVLLFSILIISGIGLSLAIKRRRLWVRATPADGDGGNGRTVIEVGGLARTDQAGYGEEFTRLARDLVTGLGTSGRRPFRKDT